MGKTNFDDVFKDPEYRRLKEEEKSVYDLLSKAADKKKLYTELEKEYRARLKEITSDVSSREGSVDISQEDAEKAMGDLKESLKDVNEQIKALRQEVSMNRLRHSMGEYDEEVFKLNRNRLREKIIKELSDRSWIQDNIALLRKIKSGARKVSDPKPKNKPAEPVKAEEPKRPKEPSREPEKKLTEEEKIRTATAPIINLKHLDSLGDPNATIMAELTLPIIPSAGDFESDKTMAIPTNLIGADPERLLEPALHVRIEDGWERFPLRDQEISIGNIHNPDNDIALRDIQVSRNHAKIIYDSPTNCWFFVDLGSRNGSFLNNSFVESNDPQLLKNNDRIILGETVILVHLPE